jgi:hypothetical protein
MFHTAGVQAVDRNDTGIMAWLMAGDVAIQYQVCRDLLQGEVTRTKSLQEKIAEQGWGARFLSKQREDGHWGINFYQPKWTSTHYTLLDLRTIGLPPHHQQVQKSVEMTMRQPAGTDGGIRLAVSLKTSDVCVNGMILNYGSYFLPRAQRLKDVVEYLLQTQMPDGGWNCEYLCPSTTHSSMHSTLSVLEGLLQFKRTGARYCRAEIIAAEKKAIEFLLKHNLYQSHRTGKTIDERFLRLSFPPRWRYDILRCLDYLQDANVHYDTRMQDALYILRARQNKNGTWPLQEKHKGAVHFTMEKLGAPSRWNTLRALRVLKYFHQ